MDWMENSKQKKKIVVYKDGIPEIVEDRRKPTLKFWDLWEIIVTILNLLRGKLNK